VFGRLWIQALDRLRLRSPGSAAAFRALNEAWRIALEGGAPERPEYSEESILALCGGQVAVIPGRGNGVLLTAADRLERPSCGLLEQYGEIVLVTRAAGEHAFHAALEQTIRKWGPKSVRVIS
jgi:hypothetical protein